MVGQKAALTETANSEPRRLLARNHSFYCAEVKAEYSLLFSNSVSRKSAPRRRGTAAISDIDEAGVTTRFRGQTFKVARFCVCRQVAPKDAGEVEWNPAPGSLDSLDGAPSVTSGKEFGNDWPLPVTGVRSAE